MVWGEARSSQAFVLIGRSRFTEVEVSESGLSEGCFRLGWRAGMEGGWQINVYLLHLIQ